MKKYIIGLIALLTLTMAPVANADVFETSRGYKGLTLYNNYNQTAYCTAYYYNTNIVWKFKVYGNSTYMLNFQTSAGTLKSWRCVYKS